MVKTQARGRIMAKVSSEVEALLKEPTALPGMLANRFMSQAAVTHAKEIIDRDLFIKASRADAELMLEILSRPAQPNAELVNLFATPKEINKSDLFR
jgi:uncharacterized protein (DUF1778 family)